MVVRGRVQRVSYRFFARRQARALGITGFVRNQPDGSVYIIAQGPENELNKFINKCYAGSHTSRVEHIDIVNIDPENRYSSFEITY